MRASFVLLLATGLGLVACGDDSDPETADLDAGSGGSSAAAGASGSGGSGGSGAAAGSGGNGGSGGSAGSAGSGGSAGGGGSGNACNDPGPEPNESEALASPACGTPPCVAADSDDEGSTGFGGPLAPATGVVGPGDVDYLKFDGEDKTFPIAVVNATAKTDDSGFRLCLFVSCDGGTTLNGCAQGNVDQSPTGIPGCCVTGPGTVEADHDCGGTTTDDDSAHVFIRVDQANACTSYTVDYHF